MRRPPSTTTAIPNATVDIFEYLGAVVEESRIGDRSDKDGKEICDSQSSGHSAAPESFGLSLLQFLPPASLCGRQNSGAERTKLANNPCKAEERRNLRPLTAVLAGYLSPRLKVPFAKRAVTPTATDGLFCITSRLQQLSSCTVPAGQGPFLTCRRNRRLAGQGGELNRRCGYQYPVPVCVLCRNSPPPLEILIRNSRNGSYATGEQQTAKTCCCSKALEASRGRRRGIEYRVSTRLTHSF